MKLAQMLLKMDYLISTNMVITHCGVVNIHVLFFLFTRCSRPSHVAAASQVQLHSSVYFMSVMLLDPK